MGPAERAKARGVSVIVPAYNEAAILEETVAHLVHALSQLDRPFEVVIADDCSKDDTLAVARSLAKADARVKAVTHFPNRGKGAAIRTGFLATAMPIVAYVDADIRPDVATLRAYLDELERGCDIVLANKWHSESMVEYTFTRKFASVGYGVFAKVLFWIPVVDTQCGFKFFDRRVLEKAIPHGRVDRFGFDVELLAWCVHYGARISALPIRIREIRESRVRLLEALKMFKDLLVARVHMSLGSKREEPPPEPERAPEPALDVAPRV